MNHAKQLPPRELFAICAPGLETIVAAELGALGWNGPRIETGVVSTTGGTAELYRACLHCRSATNLRVRVGRLSAGSLEGLSQGLRKLQWSLFVHSGQPVQVEISKKGARLGREDAIARKAELAIGDTVRGPRMGYAHGGTPIHRMPPALVHLRIEGEQIEASVDPVGDALWKRGYRSRGGAAPLRENLAAAALQAMGWQPPRPLIDPFCGSGTILIEAALLATGRAPGAGRRFAFESWPCHAAKLWRQLQAESPRSLPSLTLLGYDADEAILTIARGNAGRAGVGALIRWGQQPVDRLAPPATGPGLVLANPPWGQRLGDRVRGVYTALGRALAAGFGGWELGLLCPDRALVKAVGVPMEPRLSFPHGGGRLTLWAGVVPTGSSRTPR